MCVPGRKLKVLYGGGLTFHEMMEASMARGILDKALPPPEDRPAFTKAQIKLAKRVAKSIGKKNEARLSRAF